LADVECKLNIMIANYERSGMGDGHLQCHGKQDEVSLANSNDDNDDQLDYQEGSNKADFLGCNRPHILYFWQLMEDNDLLKKGNVHLKNCGVLSEKYSDTSSSSGERKHKVLAEREHKRQAQEKQDDMVCKRMGSDIRMLCVNQSHRFLMTMMERKMMAESDGNERLVKFYEQQIDASQHKK